MNQMADPNNPFTNVSVLVVDDEVYACKLAMSALNQIGIEDVMSVKSGKEAIEVLQMRKFDLVLSDWTMPEMTGLDLLKAVRQMLPDLPFIMLTGNTTKDSVLAAKEQGIDGYIAKPFAPARLRAKIAPLLKL